MVKNNKSKEKVRYKNMTYSKTTAGTEWLLDSGAANPKKKRSKSLADVIV